MLELKGLQIGDELQFRPWRALASEYRIDCDGDIPVEVNGDEDDIWYFSGSLKYLCGTTCEILNYEEDDGMVNVKYTDKYGYIEEDWFPREVFESYMPPKECHAVSYNMEGFLE